MWARTPGIEWTAFRKLQVQQWLADGLSRDLIADRLGITRGGLNSMIWRHGLQPRDLLKTD